MNIILCGTPNTTVTVGAMLINARHTIVQILCPFPKPAGRKKVLTVSKIQHWAESQNIPYVQVDRALLQDKTVLRKKLLPADILVVVDFGFLIPTWLLCFPEYKGLNIHPSLLPSWRGATPVPFQLLFGEKESGVTIIKMNEKFDKGGIIAQEKVSMFPSDTTPDLLYRSFQVGARLLIKILPKYIKGNIQIEQQSYSSQTPTTPRLKKEDGYVPLGYFLHQTPKEPIALLQKYSLPSNLQNIERMVRSLQPWPKVWTILPDNKRLIIHEVTYSKKNHVPVLQIQQAQIEGKTVTDFSTVQAEYPLLDI